MLLKILGFADFLTAVIILLLHFNVINSWRIPLLFIIYLLSKVVVFHNDIASFIDLVIAGYVVLLLFNFHPLILTVVAVLYLLQKAVMSFL